MAMHQFNKGELAYWLGVIADRSRNQGARAKEDTLRLPRDASHGQDAGSSGEPAEPVPQRFIDALLVLRCIEIDPSGTPVVTDKGRLALHMESGPYSAS